MDDMCLRLPAVKLVTHAYIDKSVPGGVHRHLRPSRYSWIKHLRGSSMVVIRSLWRFLVGVKDALVLFFLLLLLLALWGVMRASAPLQVPDGSALVLDLDGFVVDQATERSPFELATAGADITPEIQVRDLIKAIDRARSDSRIKAIVLDLDNFYGAGQANLQSIGAALNRFRAAKKPVYAYATAYIDDSYYLAAHATEVWLNPLGGVLLTGPGGSNLYFRQALDKLAIDVNVFRVGTYKAAVEPFTRDTPSPEARAAEQALVDTLWDSYTADVQARRPKVNIDAFLGDLPGRVQAAGGDFAKTALANGFVDKLGTSVSFGEQVRKLAGAPKSDDVPGAFNGIGFRDYISATQPLTGESGDAVGVVYVSGTIVDGKAPRGTAGGDTISEQIQEALANDNIKALVVRIDSPGGSVTASEKVRQALATAKAEGLPVVASMGPVAASGGYWIASAADEIYAQPSTITGSIGVFAIIPTFQRTLTDLGINAEGVKSTPYSGEPDIFDGLTPETRAILQASVEDIYRRFTGIVAQSRKLPIERVDQIGQGRVWAGATAQQLKLVDHIGGLDAAVAAAAKRAGLDPDVRTIDVEVKPSLPFQILDEFFGPQDREQQAHDPFAKLARNSQLRLAAAIADASVVASGPTMQARCLSCVGHAPPRPVATAARSGFLAAVLGLLR